MRATAENIVRRLRDAGQTAYFAGGCVRDMVRGVEPHDFDIATTATPEQVRQVFPRTIPVGAAFGVILVLEGDHQFEVATFRSDAAYMDGRHPSAVRYGSPAEDAQRRDFTVNGLFFDPCADGAPGASALPGGSGRALAPRQPPGLIDFVGGVADIDRQIIRCIGEPRHRFAEDKLRLLRAVRFAANLGFEIEPATFAAVQEMAGQIHVVSAERIRDELIKIFTRPNAGRGLELLEKTGLLKEVLPEVAAMRGVEQPPAFHPEGDVFTHTKIMLDTLPADTSLELAFAVLLHDVGKPPTFVRAPDRIRFNEHDRVGAEMTEVILRRLRFSNEQIDQISLCVREHMKFQFVQEMRPAKLKRLLGRPTFSTELELHRIDCLSSHRNLENYDFLTQKLRELPPEVIKPEPLLTGHDLLALGFTPGPLVGQVLQEVAEAQLDERLRSREEALAYARHRRAELPNTD
ncbi:MAG: Poly(A) polymerase I [Verrucomicrobiae bacterium]|nr:Poly(A) polymerase I [Verrucomicrobiae bacterium]